MRLNMMLFIGFGITLTTSLSAAFCNMECPTFGGHLDLLVWNVYGGGLDYATLIENITVVETDSLVSVDNPISRKSFHFQFNPGVRLGLGAQLPNCCGDVSLTWTYYRNLSHERFHTNTQEDRVKVIISPYFAYTKDVQVSATSQNFDAKMRFRFNRIDLAFSKECCTACGFSFSPSLGGIYFQTKQDMRLNQEIFSEIDDEERNYRVNFRTLYRGIGLAAGIETKCHFQSGIELRAGGNFAATVGPYELHYRGLYQSETAAVVTTDRLATFQRLHGDFDEWRGRSITSIYLLAGYDFTSCCGTGMRLEAGWEWHCLLDQTSLDMANVFDEVLLVESIGNTDPNVPSRSASNLYMHGVTVSLRMDY